MIMVMVMVMVMIVIVVVVVVVVVVMVMILARQRFKRRALPSQTKFINYVNVFWRDRVPLGVMRRIITRQMNLVRLCHEA